MAMRTTIDLDPSILKETKELARKRGMTLGETVSTLIARALADEERREEEVPPFHWFSKPMRLKVDLEDKDAVEAALASEE
jgi:macrodomain Ter protein organizer (MatP/YcbG family)